MCEGPRRVGAATPHLEAVGTSLLSLPPLCASALEPARVPMEGPTTVSPTGSGLVLQVKRVGAEGLEPPATCLQASTTRANLFPDVRILSV